MPRRLVIIGNSAAGLAAIKALSPRERRARLTLIASERHPPYSRVLLTYWLSGKINRDGLFLHSPDWYRQIGVTALLGQRAVAIDTRRREVRVEPGRVPRGRRRSATRAARIPYDQLLIATGAQAQRPALPGIDLPGVFCLRDLDDAAALRAYADQQGLFMPAALPRRARAVFLGGGPVCLQGLTALASRGMQVTLVVRSSTILSQLADAHTAGLAERSLKANGVRVVKQAEPVGIAARSGTRAPALHVHLRDGRRLPTDLVVIGKGTRPNTELAASAGIATDVGILVDETMATSAEGVFAAGDVAQATHCVSGRKVCYGTWTNATEQGRIAGLNMLGQRTEWTGGLNRNVATIFGNTLGSVGLLPAADARRSDGVELFHYQSRRRTVSRRLVFRQGRCAGAVVWNAVNDLGVLAGLISTQRDCTGWEERLARGDATCGETLRQRLARSWSA
ncbi:MAG: FAD-dependent oxidoreductase [Planctomycetes bacterium]|nr:FAD-dependent oxidoreductase [Planctomycetota bacterium]